MLSIIDIVCNITFTILLVSFLENKNYMAIISVMFISLNVHLKKPHALSVTRM